MNHVRPIRENLSFRLFLLLKEDIEKLLELHQQWLYPKMPGAEGPAFPVAGAKRR
jgi:hypothetical protein